MILFPPYIPPPEYETVVSSEQRSSDPFKFNRFTILDSKESITLEHFMLLGGSITDKQLVETFLKENSIVSDNLIATATKLTDSFNEKDFSSLQLELTEVTGENPELFIILKTEKNSQDIIASLRHFDEWFIPTIFKDFTRFNINLDFV